MDNISKGGSILIDWVTHRVHVLCKIISRLSVLSIIIIYTSSLDTHSFRDSASNPTYVRRYKDNGWLQFEGSIT